MVKCFYCGKEVTNVPDDTVNYICPECKPKWMQEVQEKLARPPPESTGPRCQNCGTHFEDLVDDKPHVCDRCGSTNICSLCCDLVLRPDAKDELLCLKCIKEGNIDCSICGHTYFEGLGFRCACVVCGTRRCEKHCQDFDIPIQRHSPKLGRDSDWWFSLHCRTCDGEVCNHCYVEKPVSPDSVAYYCKKCGSYLEVFPAKYRPYQQSNQELFYSEGVSLLDLIQSCMHCPTCGKPLTHIEQYDRWYCYNCKKYP